MLLTRKQCFLSPALRTCTTQRSRFYDRKLFTVVRPRSTGPHRDATGYGVSDGSTKRVPNRLRS